MHQVFGLTPYTLNEVRLFVVMSPDLENSVFAAKRMALSDGASNPDGSSFSEHEAMESAPMLRPIDRSWLNLFILLRFYDLYAVHMFYDFCIYGRVVLISISMTCHSSTPTSIPTSPSGLSGISPSGISMSFIIMKTLCVSGLFTT